MGRMWLHVSLASVAVLGVTVIMRCLARYPRSVRRLFGIESEEPDAPKEVATPEKANSLQPSEETVAHPAKHSLEAVEETVTCHIKESLEKETAQSRVQVTEALHPVEEVFTCSLAEENLERAPHQLSPPDSNSLNQIEDIVTVSHIEQKLESHSFSTSQTNAENHIQISTPTVLLQEAAVTESEFLSCDQEISLESSSDDIPRSLSTSPSPISTDDQFELLSSDVTVEDTMSKTPAQCRVLTINDNEHQECILYRLQKGWVLRFRLGPSLFGKEVSLFVNHPEKPEDVFHRNKYRQLAWKHSGSKGDVAGFYADVQIVSAGSFRYYFTYDTGDWHIEPLLVPNANGISENFDIDAECLTAKREPKARPKPSKGDIYGEYLEERLKNDPAKAKGSGFFIVDPDLYVGNGKVLPLDCVQAHTVMVKQLGPLPEWEGRLRVSKESGYNAIHFTPIQELGQSNSAYSLKNQLKLNPNCSTPEKTYTLVDVQTLVKKMNKEWETVSLCDIVLNHTANESQWILDHPECSYNLINCPHLRPAYLLDRCIWHITLEIIDGKWESSGIPANITEGKHLNMIKEALLGYFLPQVKISELFQVNVDVEVETFRQLAKTKSPLTDAPPETRHLVIIQDPQYRRLKSTIDMELALRIHNTPNQENETEEGRIQRGCDGLRGTLEFLNRVKQKEIQTHLEHGIDNVMKGATYERLDPAGPKLGPFDKTHPLSCRYFTHYGPTKTLEEEEKLMYSDKGAYIMAHNGWVMGDNPLKNFAAPGSNVYLRRELIAWGDSVKLRYGDGPQDCPYLWKHMEKYVEDTAKIFHGIRLDNCHSTPIHVAEHLLDIARRVRPDLYVIAELFTSSETTDNVFVNRLGINSLIREALSAWDSHEQGRLVFRYGGEPVGAFFQPLERPLFPSVAHAIFNDLTHDNPSAIQKRSVYDLLPSSGLVGMACCASGSNRGYDELVPHHIHVVKEKRLYQTWSDEKSVSYASLQTGIIKAKKAVNKLHYYMGYNGFSQVFVDQVNEHVVAVTRHNPITHESIIMVVHSSFGHPDHNRKHVYIHPLKIQGTLEEYLLEARIVHANKKDLWDFPNDVCDFSKDENYINGLENYRVGMRENIKPSEASMLSAVQVDHQTLEFYFSDFTPGSIVAFKMFLPQDVRDNIKKIRNFTGQQRTTSSPTMETPLASELQSIVSKLSLSELNRVLYRCDAEERDEGRGGGTYSLDNIGSLPYSGLQGFMTLLDPIRLKNDLGHPLCNNLRNGNWMMDYISNRLKHYDKTAKLGKWFETVFDPLKKLPRYLIPCYFDSIMCGVDHCIHEHIWSLMGKFVSDGSDFVKALALGSVQMGGFVDSSPLPELSPHLSPPKPPMKDLHEGVEKQACTTLSAGLPHFTCGYMRNWGRDTFISIRGLFLLTERYDEARLMILGFAGCLRHGLIPNLLDRGTNSRFNCRDATWWWLQCIQDYCSEAPNGTSILNDTVSRLYPTDDSPALIPGQCDQKLHEVMQEALQRHFEGVSYRERNAGTKIDEQMRDEGFNNFVGVSLETGFVHGGNVHNCGTWMDKMGSSDIAGNKGQPATPRDGAAVEIVGLCKSATRWLHTMHEKCVYPHAGVTRIIDDGKKVSWSWKDWDSKIQNSFEKHFWINTKATPEMEPKPQLINRRGIYKDSFGATQFWADYQLRPNFTIAMTVAPELFVSSHAWTALDTAEKLLVGPLGMRTLDPGDWSYRGDYDNGNNSADKRLARGFNYHQGPEWVWPMGFYLRARLHFSKLEGGDSLQSKTAVRVKSILSKHFTEVESSSWKGLPELTNSNGQYCRDSCRTQAWSMACILEVLNDLRYI